MLDENYTLSKYSIYSVAYFKLQTSYLLGFMKMLFLYYYETFNILQIIWGNMGMADSAHSSGVIVGGTDKGLVGVWDASKLIMQESDSQMLSLTKHVGNVAALDFNKYQVRKDSTHPISSYIIIQ